MVSPVEAGVVAPKGPGHVFARRHPVEVQRAIRAPTSADTAAALPGSTGGTDSMLRWLALRMAACPSAIACIWRRKRFPPQYGSLRNAGAFTRIRETRSTPIPRGQDSIPRSTQFAPCPAPACPAILGGILPLHSIGPVMATENNNNDRNRQLLHLQLSAVLAVEDGAACRRSATPSTPSRTAQRAAGDVPAHPVLPQTLQVLLLPRLHPAERRHDQELCRRARPRGRAAQGPPRHRRADAASSSTSAAARRRTSARSSCRCCASG